MSAEVIPFKPKKKQVYEKVIINGKEEPYLQRHTVSGIYYVRRSISGKSPLFESTKTDVLKDAKRIRDELIAEYTTGTKRPGKALTVAEVADQMLKVLEGETRTPDANGRMMRSERTYEKDCDMVPIIKRYFGTMAIDKVTPIFWKDWRIENQSKITQNIFDLGKYLSKVMTFAAERSIIPGRVKIDIPNLDAKKKKHVYTDEQIRALLENADPLLFDMIVYNAPTGSRPEEVLALHWEFVHFQKDGRVLIDLPAWFTKTAKGRRFYVNAKAADMLRRRHKVRDPRTKYVFPAPKDPLEHCSRKHENRMFRRACEAAGLPDTMTFHHLRHTMYTRTLMEAKLPVQHVSLYGGTSIRTLQKNYLQSKPEDTAMVGEVIDLDLPESVNSQAATTDCKKRREKSVK